MRTHDNADRPAIARRVGLAWLALIIVGVLAAVLLGQGIDINLSADIEAVATAMLDAETRLRGLAWVSLLRDFIPAIGSGEITIAFMLANMTALVLTSGYLAVRGVRTA